MGRTGCKSCAIIKKVYAVFLSAQKEKGGIVMEKKPLSAAVKIMGVLLLIQCVVMIVLLVLGFKDLFSAKELDMGALLNLIVTSVCMVVDIIAVLLAFQHKALGFVCSAVVAATIFAEVFNIVDASGVVGYLKVVAGIVIPFVFYYVVYKQRKADQGN